MFFYFGMIVTMNNKLFDQWAKTYEEDVKKTQDNNEYPFAGYDDVLNEIVLRVSNMKATTILDIGIGSGTLAHKLSELNCEITGVDASSEMLAITKQKVPNSILHQYDIEKGLPENVLNKKYDVIISTYTLHHLNDEKKVQFINMLLELLNEGGKILIGDISFETRDLEEDCKTKYSELWDNDEYYFISQELKEIIPNSLFIKKSFCAGIFEINKE